MSKNGKIRRPLTFEERQLIRRLRSQKRMSEVKGKQAMFERLDGVTNYFRRRQREEARAQGIPIQKLPAATFGISNQDLNDNWGILTRAEETDETKAIVARVREELAERKRPKGIVLGTRLPGFCSGCGINRNRYKKGCKTCVSRKKNREEVAKKRRQRH